MPSAKGVPNQPFATASLRALRYLAACVAVAATFVLDARLARADAREERLVVLVDPGAPTLARRLREEIEALGLEVRTVPLVEPDLPLEVRARSAGAVAAIRIAASGTDAVEMTIVDRATGKTVQRRLAIATPSDPASAELIATRTVELLRASFLELASAHPPRGEVAVPAEVTETIVRESEGATRYSLGFGPAVVFATGAEAFASGWVAFTFRARSGFGGNATWVAPTGNTDLVVPEGTIELSPTQYRFAATYEPPAFGSGFSLRLLAGAELVHLALEGRTKAPYVGESEDLFAAGPWLGAELGYEVTQNLAALVRADAAATFPRLVIRSAEREVATWGRFLGGAAIGLEVAWR